MSDPVATQQQIVEFRSRIMAGEELTEQELRSAWAAYRQKRQSAAELAANSGRKSSTKPVRSAAELQSLFAAPTTTKQ